MKRLAGMIALTAALAFDLAATRGSPILDQSFFSAVPHALIDFETDGAGNTITLNQGFTMPMPADAYVSRGILFDRDIEWVNDGGTSFDAAQAIGGSPEVAIPGGFNEFVIHFLIPARAFGFWVVNNRQVSGIPSFEARDSTGEVIETVTFDGAAIDGTIGVAQYGFLGIALEEDIHSVRLQKEAAQMDDFRFTSVPEPGSLLLVAVVGIMIGTRPRFRPGEGAV